MASTALFAVLAVALVAGVSAKSPQKIVGGHPAAPGEFPYQVSLRVRGRHFCGGAIVSSRHIVTAAHCVALMKESITVVTGTISSTEGEVHTPAQIVYNQDYTPGVPTSPHDIAVITLADEIIFNEYQNKINLPSGPVPSGVTATSTGWGYTNAIDHIAPEFLNQVQLQTLSPTDCQKMFGARPTIYSTQVCTFSGAGLGTCPGDSGGPLQYNNELIGVVSWGIPCAVGVPDVFTDVFQHLTWLNSIINA